MPTLNDVAKACNVSAMTVSCVLNDKPGRVSAATRERVLRTVRELNYYPNAVARGLTGQRLNTLGVVYLHSHNPIHTSESFAMMLDGILDRATWEKQDTLMCTSYSWEDGVRDVSRLLDRRCDGLILVVPSRDNSLIPVLRDAQTPTVLLCAKSDEPNISWVDTDNREAARQLAHRVFDLGHRRAAVFHWRDEARFLYCTERVEGYRQALRERGLAENSLWITPPLTDAEFADVLRAAPPDERPTVIFAVTDRMALDMMALLNERELRIPADISVVGFDDIPSASRSVPGLTTVRQPLKRIGQKCVELLLAQLSGTVEGGRKIVFETEFIERGSLAPPARIAGLPKP